MNNNIEQNRQQNIEQDSENPLLIESRAPFNAPEFEKIKNHHYMPAFKEAVRRAKIEVDKIANDVEKPTFQNTIIALEYAAYDLDRVAGIFFNLLEANSDDEMREIAEDLSPILTEYEMYVSLNEKLFSRVELVYKQYKKEIDSLNESYRRASRPSKSVAESQLSESSTETRSFESNLEAQLSESDLDKESLKLLDETYKDFVRSGAGLKGEDKEKYSKLNERLSLLELKFSENVLEATNAFKLHVENKDELKGLPDYILEEAASLAKEEGKQGWLFSLDFSVYNPFMEFCENRDLRYKMYMAYNSRAIDGKFDNKPIITEMVKIRAEISNLLGYKTYADYALEERMAHTKENVEVFLNDLVSTSLPYAHLEVDAIKDYAHTHGLEGEFRHWDFKFYAEKLKQDRYNIDDSLLKPYFKLDKCVNALFSLANRLYGLTFEERFDIPKYHNDVKVFEVFEPLRNEETKENKKHLALLYMDFFPRKSKQPGAWMTEFRDQYTFHGKDIRPFISMVTNISKPTAEKPSLLTHSELITLLHEFGHALHGMLSKGTYPSMTGTSVARDFVELPSQIMENWGYEPEFLNTFATHYVTGEKIPEEYLDKIVEAKNYLAGYKQVRQLHFGIIDMAWHDSLPQTEFDVVGFEQMILEPYRTLEYVPGTDVSTAFAHIFSGGYSAGYYSYKWAEVLEADAFGAFKEKGIFNKEVADRFRTCILERGSSDDELQMYINFRGRKPDNDALMQSLELK